MVSILLALQTITPGDGGDNDPLTFSFYADNALKPLTDERYRPLSPERVAFDYGTHYRVLADGVDVCSVEYAWKLGYGGDHPVIQPMYVPLKDWENVRVENGWLAIDPKLGRFKFAPANRLDSPVRAVFRKRVTLGNLTTWRLIVRNKFVYLAQEEETHSVQIIDATDPKNPRYAGYSSMGGYPQEVALGEKHAYVFGSGYVNIANIEDPYRVVYIKTFYDGGSQSPFTSFVDSERKRLYHSSRRGIVVFDISDEDDPELIGEIRGSGLTGYTFRGDLLYGVAVEKEGKKFYTRVKVGKVGDASVIRSSGVCASMARRGDIMAPSAPACSTTAHSSS